MNVEGSQGGLCNVSLTGLREGMGFSLRDTKHEAVWAQYLFEVFTEDDAEAAVPVVEHLTGHQSVEHGRTHQRNAEVEPKQPPVLDVLIVLQENHNRRTLVHRFYAGETQFLTCQYSRRLSSKQTWKAGCIDVVMR